MKYILYILFLEIIIAFGGFAKVNGQTNTKSQVAAMFPPNTRDLWINYLSGTIDDLHVVDMIIGTDGHSCKGLYTMRNSGITFTFEGDDNDHQLKLVELNNEGRLTGFLYGRYDGQSFDGLWMNTKKNLSLPFKLSFVNSFIDYKGLATDRCQWYQCFSGKVDNKNVKLAINREKELYTCQVWQDDRKNVDIILGRKEGVTTCLDLNMAKTVLNDKIAIIDTSNISKLEIKFRDNNGNETSTTLKSERRLDFETYEYADYLSRLECVRPILNHKKFDPWIEEKLIDWLDETISKLKATNPKNIGTYERWTQLFSGWVEVDLYIDDVISGTIYMQSSQTPKTEKIPFIYDLKSNKEIEIETLFNEDFDSKDYFKHALPAKKKEVKWKPDVKTWVDGQKFSHVTLKDNGFCFKTDFSTIYGEKEIIIPYQELAVNLKNRSVIKELFTK